MTDEEAMRHAWDQVKDSLDSETWSVGDAATFFGFFTHGWIAQRRWKEHKASDQTTRQPDDGVERVFAMEAEIVADCYDGPTCDQIKPLIRAFAEGDMEAEQAGEDPVIFDRQYFPIGSRLTITTPICPDCGAWWDAEHPPGNPPTYQTTCECGFSWEEWVLDTYS